MRRVPSTNTRLEQLVHQALQTGGVPYSIDHQGLPGKPDIILPQHHTAIFVHGCFWHGHSRCLKGRTLPARNRSFWTAKQTYNRANHRRVTTALRRMGWKVWVAWECQITNPRRLARLLARRLPGSRTLTNPC
jgi:DNA mismatch endonuclease (patch repair protein)